MINLFDYQDTNYQKFHKKLVKNDNISIIGIRMPILKEIARNMAKNNDLEYIYKEKIYYEEVMLHGLILGYLDIPFEKLLIYLDDFIPLVNNWAICDSTCSNLRLFKTNQEQGFKYIKKLLEGEEFSVRFGLVLMLNYYINDNYIDEVLKIISTINNDKYYVLMANAWLISICYIKYKSKTLKLLKGNIDDNLKKKAISKICDSYRVTREDKMYLKDI